MVKVFLSHSSVQKPLIMAVAKELGHNTAIVDEYTFEACKDIWEEIRQAIDNSRIFVYFISREAIESPWVKREMGYVAEKVLNDEILFLPFLIDETEHTDPSIKPWIRNNLLLKRIESAKLIAKRIRQHISLILLQEHLVDNPHDYLFEGRDDDMKYLRQALNTASNDKLRGIFVSGQIGSGRQRLLKEVINNHIRADKNQSYRPINIKLDENATPDELIGVLNDYTRTYTPDRLLDKLRDRDGILEAAVRVFNDLEESREYAVIEDRGAIVKSNGRLVDWFRDLMHDERLLPRIHFFIAAKYAPYLNERQVLVAIGRRIHLIDEMAIRSLLHAYLKLRDISLADNECKERIVSLSKGYPEVVYITVDKLKSTNIVELRKFLNNYVGPHDLDISKQVSRLAADVKNRALLVLLSKFDFITFPTLRDLFGEQETVILDILDTMLREGICDAFGKGNSYLRLAPPVRDYITRNPNEYALDLKYKTRLRTKMAEYIDDINEEYLNGEDYATILLTAKAALKSKGIKNLPKRFLIPAFILKVVMEEYNARNYDVVIELAKAVLYEYNAEEIYESLKSSIRYWYCMALARKNDDHMLKEADMLNDYNRSFVRGFYYSCLSPANYSAAVKEYEKALVYSPKAIKAKHQLVVCLQKLDRHNEAVKLAMDCYEEDPRSPYYIHAYFESLLKSESKDPSKMGELIKSMNEISGREAKAICSGMKAQYDYYVYKDLDNAIRTIENALNGHMDDESREKILRIAKEITTDAKVSYLYDKLKRIGR